MSHRETFHVLHSRFATCEINKDITPVCARVNRTETHEMIAYGFHINYNWNVINNTLHFGQDIQANQRTSHAHCTHTLTKRTHRCDVQLFSVHGYDEFKFKRIICTSREMRWDECLLYVMWVCAWAHRVQLYICILILIDAHIFQHIP